MCTSLIFSIFRVMCLSQQSVLKCVHDPPLKETLCPLAVPSSSTSSSPALCTTCLLTVCIGFPVLEISYKWNHAVCSLLWLTCFYNIFKVYPCCSLSQYIIPFYDKIIFYCMDIPYFVYPFVSWWTFGTLYFLTTMNNAMMNIPVQYVFILLICTENSVAGWYDNPMSNVLRIC